MKLLQRSRSQVLLLALSLLGAGIAIYLTSVHYANAPLVCSESGIINCAHVLSSSYAVIPGTSLPITIPGLGWCVVSAALAIAGLYAVTRQWQRWIRLAQFTWALSGLLAVLYLVYVELVLLHSICMWCTILHIIILAMFLITLVRLPQPQLESEPEPETFDAEKPFVPTLRDQR